MFILTFYLKENSSHLEEMYQASVCGQYSTLWHIWYAMKGEFDITIRDGNGLELDPSKGISPRY